MPGTALIGKLRAEQYWGTNTFSAAPFILSASAMYRWVVVNERRRIFFCNTDADMVSALNVA